MRRTQLYLDDELWRAIHARARRENTTISELVRQAVRERYIGSHEQRAKAMQRVVGIRRSSDERLSAVEEVRQIRRGSRLEKLTGR